MHALYAGSFDPPTRGHLDLVRRAAALFDEVTVAIGHNPAKRYLFDRPRRRELFLAELGDVPNVAVVDFDGLLVHAARDIGADVLVRGLRGPSDLDLEQRNGLANRDMTGIETLFLLADPALAFVSSSLVKEIWNGGGDVGRYVTPGVLAAMCATRETA
ncbi:MAG: pantetheine-phosphate adenylyltransferase [Alphaproteobacteria bacterium]|nr:pantetheine-phosphate adenylyltransferase [Alphaproteobacteria bacterium]MCB9690550.1 pantetheine-phosphate adenylyltransferase [Alphaproteobacteria bacterium]